MRLSATEPQFHNKNINFCGNKNPKFVSDKYFGWMYKINGVHQRAILGGSALLLQTPIDYYNPKADEKTRNYSTMKTLVKIIVGTIVGVGVRALGIKYAEHLTKDPKKLISKVKNPEISKELKRILGNSDDKESFEANLGTLMGVVAVFLSNFTIDMPLAKFAIGKTSQALNLSEDKHKEDKDA